MFKKILIPIDLTELTIAKPALDAAVELALQSKGALRLITIETLLPASFMEYVPPEFDKSQEERAARALEEIGAGLAIPKEGGEEALSLEDESIPDEDLAIVENFELLENYEFLKKFDLADVPAKSSSGVEAN